MNTGTDLSDFSATNMAQNVKKAGIVLVTSLIIAFVIILALLIAILVVAVQARDTKCISSES